MRSSPRASSATVLILMNDNVNSSEANASRGRAKASGQALKAVAGFSPRTDTILIAVTGMSPAILTETIWALAQEQPPVVPDRVWVLTTSDGWARVEKDLLSCSVGQGGTAVWDSLRGALAEQGLNVRHSLRLEHRVMQRWDDTNGRYSMMADIRSEDDNRAAADFLLEQVRNAVETPGSQVVASIAGGRKTMGALLYAAMTLLGRPEDRLTHVLVSAPFDSPLEPRFYFPNQPTAELRTPDGKTVLANSALVELADVPFVSLRKLFERDLIRQPAKFTDLVTICRGKLDEMTRVPCTLLVKDDVPEVCVNGSTFHLSPAKYALLRWLAERALNGEPPINGAKPASDSVRDSARRIYESRRTLSEFDWSASICAGPSNWKDLDDRWVVRTLSELRGDLKKRGGDGLSLLARLPKKGQFQLDLPASSITIKGLRSKKRLRSPSNEST